MSGKVEPGKVPEITHGYGGGAASRLEITVAIRNKKTGAWETPRLDAAESHAVKGAIETIRQAGAQARAGAWKAFNQDGAVLEMTNKGVFVKEGEGWKDLLSDQTVEGPLRGSVRKTLGAVTNILGRQAKTKGKEQAPREIAANAEALHQGEVVIQVRVVPTAAVFAQRCEAEQTFYDDLAGLQTYVRDPAVASFLLAHGFSDEQIFGMQGKMDALAASSKDVLDTMLRVRGLLDAGNIQEAVSLYGEQMPARYGAFSDAMREWQREQRALSNVLGGENTIFIATNHIEFQLGAASELFALAHHAIPNQVDTTTAFSQIARQKTSFDSELRLAQVAERKVSAALNNEKTFNQQITDALGAFDDPVFTEGLIVSGWDRDEMNEHKTKLEALKVQSDKAVEILENTRQWLSAGYVQEGMNYYGAEMHEHYPAYSAACQELAIPQKIAEGRTLTQPLRPLAIDLKHAQDLLGVLEDVSIATREADVVGANGQKAIDEEVWNRTLSLMEAQAGVLQDALKFSVLTHTLNDIHQRGLEFANNLGLFVAAYQNNRELFEMIMRKHGISDIESAFIFNNYETVLQAIKDWNGRFQAIADLANRKEYGAALQAYADLVIHTHPQFLEKVRNFNLTSLALNDPRVEEAFKEFAHEINLRNSTQTFHVLNIQREANKALLTFNGCLEAAKKHNEEAEVKIPIPENAREAIAVIKGGLEGTANTAFPEFSRLFEQNLHVMQFFNDGGLMLASHPLHQQWQALLKKYGWRREDMEAFTTLTNRYAALIRPLKQAQQAVATESDPIKKRALQAQLKELARELMPQVNQVQKKWKQHGGMEKFRSMVNAARDLGSDSAIGKAQQQLEKLYVEKKGIYQAAGFASHADLLDKLEQYVQEWPGDRAHMAKSYEQELRLVRLLKGVKGLQAHASDIVHLMDDRVAYMDHLYADLGLYTPIQEGTISRALLQGAHGRDPVFAQILRDHGWSKAGIQRLNTWYDAYTKEARPLEQAKKALDADPENVTLQNEFKKVAKEQIPKLNALSKEFRGKIGTIESLRSLDWALSLYGNRVAKNLANLESTLSLGTLRREQAADLERQAAEVRTTLKMLSTLRIADTVERIDAFVAEADRTARLPMSWDRGFLSLLVPDKSSPLMQLKPNGNDPLWPKLLQQNGVDVKDVKSVLKLLNKYQAQTEKIMVLERKLEAHPGNDRLRRELMNELQSKTKALVSLKKEYDLLAPKIEGLQLAVLSFQKHLAQGHEKVQAREAMLNPRILGDIREQLEKGVVFERRQQFGDLSEGQVLGLTRLANELHVLDAFNQKRAFVRETLRTFTTL